MESPDRRPEPDAVVEAYKKDVDVTLLDRNLRLTPTERLEQLQRFVHFLSDVRSASASMSGRRGPGPD